MSQIKTINNNDDNNNNDNNNNNNDNNNNNNNHNNNNNNNNILLHDSYRSPKAGKWWNKQGRWVKCNISAIAKEAEIDKNVSRKHVDKTHPISGAKNGNQVRIIKLATRESFSAA